MWERCRGKCTLVLMSDAVCMQLPWNGTQRPQQKLHFTPCHCHFTSLVPHSLTQRAQRTNARCGASKTCVRNSCRCLRDVAKARHSYVCVGIQLCADVCTYICSKSLCDGCSNLRPRLVTQQRINVRSTRLSVHRATHPWRLHLSQSAARVPLTTSRGRPCVDTA